MKAHNLFPLYLLLLAIPVVAQQGTIYSNGAINGNTDAWTINFGFVVSDTFTVGTGDTPVTGLSFGAWVSPGDVLESAEVSISSAEFGGTNFFDGIVNFTQSACLGNTFGFNVCTETGSFNGPALDAGTYWLNLSNAMVNTGDPIYWDENSGPSMASENSVGTVPSEAFTLLGGTTTTTFAYPEPNIILYFGSGLVGVMAVLRRRLF